MRSRRAAISRYSAASFSPSVRDTREELLGDAGDRDVVDVDLLVADQREQQVERAAEMREFNRKTVGVAGRRAGGLSVALDAKNGLDVVDG